MRRSWEVPPVEAIHSLRSKMVPKDQKWCWVVTWMPLRKIQRVFIVSVEMDEVDLGDGVEG